MPCEEEKVYRLDDIIHVIRLDDIIIRPDDKLIRSDELLYYQEYIV